MNPNLFIAMNTMILTESWDELLFALEDEIEADEEFQEVLVFLRLDESADLSLIQTDAVTLLVQAYMSSVEHSEDEPTTNEALLMLHTMVQNIQVR